MHTVVKGTKTIAEFKHVKATMEQLAMEFSTVHKASNPALANCEIVKVWYDCYNNLVIEYSNGDYWHYDSEGRWFSGRQERQSIFVQGFYGGH